jgi:hypothetical protein
MIEETKKLIVKSGCVSESGLAWGYHGKRSKERVAFLYPLIRLITYDRLIILLPVWDTSLIRHVC